MTTTPLLAAEWAVRYLGYFILSGAFGGFLFCLFRAVDWSRLPSSLRRRDCLWGALVVSVGLWTVFIHAEFGHKIALDDYVLSATAKSMHESREVAVTTLGLYYGDDFISKESFVDKRPFFYPYLVSIVHDVWGYSTSNAFVVNAVACAAFLVLAFVLGCWLSNAYGGILSVLLWASLPLLAQNATGAGMEMVNLLLIQVLMVGCVSYLNQPSAAKEGILSLGCVLLVSTRYESALFILPVGMIILIGWRRAGQVFLSWGTVLAPVFLIVGVFQLRIYGAAEVNWELQEGATSPFAWEHLLENWPHALHFFFSLDQSLANSPLLGVLGLLMLVCGVVGSRHFVSSKWLSDTARCCFSVFAVFLVVHLLVMLSFHAGKLDHRFVSRYALPVHIFIVCGTVLVVNACSLKWRPIWWGCIGALLLYVQVVTMPANSKSIFNHANFAVKEFDWLSELSEDQLEPRSIYVDVYPVFWALNEMSAISPRRALTGVPSLLRSLEKNTFASIYLIRRAHFDGRGFSSDEAPFDEIDDRVELELIAEKSFRPLHITQVYRVADCNINK